MAFSSYFWTRAVYCTRFTIMQKVIQNPQFVIPITRYTEMPLLYELYGESLFRHFIQFTGSEEQVETF